MKTGPLPVSVEVDSGDAWAQVDRRRLQCAMNALEFVAVVAHPSLLNVACQWVHTGYTRKLVCSLHSDTVWRRDDCAEGRVE